MEFFLVFCYISNMLVQRVASSQCPSLEYASKVKARKFPSIYIFVADFFTSSRLDQRSKTIRLLPSIWCRQDEQPLSLAWHMRTSSFFGAGGTSSFPESFKIKTKALAWIYRDCLFSYLFIHLFNFTFLSAVQLRYRKIPPLKRHHPKQL